MNISHKKSAGYHLYGILYSVFKLLPVKKTLAYFIMTHDSSAEGNCGVMKAFLEAAPYKLECRCLTRSDTRRLSFIFSSALTLARSRFVFMDNAFLPLAYLKLRKGTTLTQLWHGTGTIKKFGQSATSGKLHNLEARCSRNISYVTVSSDATAKLYAECFGVPKEKVIITGLPRSDAFFKDNFASSARTRLEADYPMLKDKKLILYAPTFRDDDMDCNAQLKIVRELVSLINGMENPGICLGLRLHPFVADAAEHSDSSSVIDLSGYDGLNTILGSTDILITDYSSIIFEYALLKRPMVFYAYDLDDFEHTGRGFYRDYRSYVPGPVVTDLMALSNAISCICKDTCETVQSQIDEFIEEAFAYTDGHSPERIMAKIC